MLQSTDNTVAGAVYSYNFTEIVYRVDNLTIPTNVTLPASLFPLTNTVTPNRVSYLGNGNNIVAGPTMIENAMYVSITRALTIQGSEDFSIPGDVLGYLTIVCKASSLLNVVQTTDLEDGSLLSVIKLDTTLPRRNLTSANQYTFNYTYVTPSLMCPNCFNRTFDLIKDSPEFYALVNGTAGAIIDYKFPRYGMVSTGYAPVNMVSQIWGVVVFQPHRYVYGPIVTIQNISIITVFSIGAGVCVVTLLLSGWVLRPITRLQAATEQSYSEPHSSTGFWKFLNKIKAFFSRKSTNQNNPNNMNKSSFNKSDITLSERGWLAHYKEEIPEFKLPEKVVSRKYIRDELTELTETFNDMTTELRKQYRHLEERVQERKKEIKDAKLLAESANEAKSLFIANITHELRTPLNGILGMASVAMEEDDPQSVRDSLKVIFKSGELLLRLLTDLLSFSKSEVDADNMKLEIKGFEISEVVSQLHAIFDESSKNSKIDFSISLTSEWLSQYELSGDVNRILQIVINLVSNSLKFTPPGGFVKVIISAVDNNNEENWEESNENKNSNDNNNKTATRNQNENENTNEKEMYIELPKPLQNPHPEDTNLGSVTVSFTVCDSGSGIAPHLQSRVFEPFVQGEIGAKETRSGAGLGLSICRELATLMRGTIDLESEVGVGSCFTFTLPMEYTNMSDNCGSKYNSLLWKLKDDDIGINSLEALNFDVSKRAGGVEAANNGGDDKGGNGDGSGSNINGNSSNGSSRKVSEESTKIEARELTNGGKDEKDLVNGFGDEISATTTTTTTATAATAGSNKLNYSENSSVSANLPESADNTNSNSSTNTNSLATYARPKSHHNSPTLNGLGPGTSLSTGSGINTLSSASNNPNTNNANPGTLGATTKKVVLDKKIAAELRVLIAEDNRVNQEVMLKMLRLEGISGVEVAKDGLEAVKAVTKSISNYETSSASTDTSTNTPPTTSPTNTPTTTPNKKKPFDVIFMDIQMPNLDGIQATEQIRKDLKYAGPIIAVSAYADKTNMDRCKLAGMNDFLAKPIKRVQLRMMLVELFNSKEEEGAGVQGGEVLPQQVIS